MAASAAPTLGTVELLRRAGRVRGTPMVLACLSGEPAGSGYARAMSWRDQTPVAVQDDLDLLANEALQAAQHFLEKNGEFYPFAMTLGDNGAPQLTGADPGGGEFPSSQEMLDLLYRGVSANRDACRAAAFAAQVTTEAGDAVRVELEHRDGGPGLQLLLAFRRKRLGKAIEFGDLEAAQGERRIW